MRTYRVKSQPGGSRFVLGPEKRIFRAIFETVIFPSVKIAMHTWQQNIVIKIKVKVQNLYETIVYEM